MLSGSFLPVLPNTAKILQLTVHARYTLNIPLAHIGIYVEVVAGVAIGWDQLRLARAVRIRTAAPNCVKNIARPGSAHDKRS